MQLEDFLSSSARKPRLRTEREVSIKLENLRNRAGMQTLDEEYERVYDENTLPGFESREHAVSAYKLLLCCVEPLSLNALAAAVAVQKGGTLHPEVTDTYILEICSNFIVIVDGYVRFAHPSAKEYLEHRGTGEIQEFGVEQQHLQAALTCLHRIENSYIGILDCWPAIRSWQKQWPDDIRFRGALPDEAPADLDELLLSLQGLLCPEPLMGSTDDSLMRELRSKRAYFTVYACYYWAYHTAKVSSAGREKEGITQEVADFMCSPLYQDWFIIEAYLRRSLPFIEDSAEFRCYEKKMNDSCGTTGWGGRGWKDKKPEPGLLIATFGLVDLLRLTRIAEDFLLYASNYNGETALHLASKYGQSQFLEEYLKRYAGSLDLEVQDRFGWTPLLTAMMYEEVENVETISILLNYGADVSKRDQHGRTVFHHLVGEWISVARLQVLTDLTKTMFEPDHWQTLLVVENDQGETALHQALRLSHEALRLSREAIFAVLFGEISDGILYRQWLTHTGDLLGISLLLTASRENCTKSLQLILQSGVPVNAAISASGVTALHVAATVEIAETLLQLDKSLLSRRDALGMTPLLSACKSTKPELCHFLLEHGADAKALDANGQSALHLWVQDQSWTPLDPIMSLLEVLIPECAGLTDPEGNTALHLIGYPSYGFGGRWWNGLVLKLLAAGEGLSTLNNKGKMAAQRLFQCLAWRFYDGKYRDDFDSYIFSWNGEQPAVWKIIIHMMKELRQAEAATRLSDEHLDLLYFYCHRLIEVSEYSNGKAEALLRERATQEDQLLLDCIQTQKASGWELPTSRNIYCLDRFGHEQRLRTA
jgi:ankyrin repeat protein